MKNTGSRTYDALWGLDGRFLPIKNPPNSSKLFGGFCSNILFIPVATAVQPNGAPILESDRSISTGFQYDIGHTPQPFPEKYQSWFALI